MKFFDLHCDTLTRCYKEKQELKENNLHVNLEKGKIFDSWIQCFAAWVDDSYRGKEAVNYINNLINLFYKELERNKNLIFIKSKKDLKKENLKNKIGAILTIEGSAALGGNLNELERFYNLGVRIMTLTWNGSSEVGDGSMNSSKRGLTVFGKKVIKKMQDLGMIIDVSHASDKLFFDIAENVERPIIATHSDSKKICNHARNLTDEQFRVIKSKKGLVGLNFLNLFLKSEDASSEDILRHAEHFLSLGGENTVCIGSDFDGAEMPIGITGLESIENLYNLFLKKYKKEIVNKIFFENSYNFFTENLQE